MNEKKPVKQYDYVDEQGILLFQVVRTEPKGFFQRRRYGNSWALGLSEGWYEQKMPSGNFTLIKDCPKDPNIPPSPSAVWLEAVVPVLYHLPEIIMDAIEEGFPVYIFEGEKDCDNAALWGFISTTCPMGALKWKANYTQTLIGCKEVIIVPDKDEPGRKHAQNVANELSKAGIKVKIVELPDINGVSIKDFSDWQEAGGQKKEFEELVRNTLYFEATPSTEPDSSLKELIKFYGEPYYLNNKGHVTDINENFWAGLYDHENILLFEPFEHFFYIYNPQTGLREVISIDRIKQEICSRMLEISRAQGLPSLELKRKNSHLNNIIEHLKGICEKRNAFDKEGKKFVHLVNGIITFNDSNEADLVTFSPEFYSRNQSPIIYNKEARCPRLLNELLLPAVNSADAQVIQKYIGLCLLGKNFIQRFLILDGEAGRGKTQLALIIQALVGRANFTELRTKHLGERFELFRYLKKTLLVGVDVPGNFLSERGAQVIKGLVGGDWFDPEQKNGTGSFPMQGNFCIVITSNSRLQIRLHSDAGAWRRRLLIVRFECPPPLKKIPDFADLLIKQEGPGILNWALEGLGMLFDDFTKHGDIYLAGSQKRTVDDLLSESDSIQHFLIERVNKDDASNLTVQEIIDAYSEYCAEKQWNPKPPTVIPKELEKYMLELFSTPKSNSVSRNGKDQKGYRRVRFNDA